MTDQADDQDTLIEVYVGRAPGGRERFEGLWVRGRPDGSYRLIRSPKMVFGVASGDTFTVGPDKAIDRVLSRGGNWAIQIVAADDLTPGLIQEIAALVGRYGGTLDVHDHQLVGCAVPKTAPWPALDRDLDALVAAGKVKAWWTGDTQPLARREG